MAITIPIVSEWNPKGLDRSVADIKRAEGGWAKAGAGFKAALLPATVALGALAVAGLEFAKAAAADEKSAATLAQALRNTTGATDSAISGVEEWISAQGRALGVADDQLRPALGTLARATGDVGKSQELAALAMDISAATGKDLGSVSTALAKAYAGNTSALGKLVPGLDKGALASKDFGRISADLAKKVGGAAATAAETSAGKYDRMTLALDEAKESVGRGLLPIMGILTDKLAGVAGWVEENSGLVTNLGIALAAIAGTIVAVNAAMSAYAAVQAIVRAATVAWTAVQWALNSAFLANPLVWIVIAVVALVAVIVLAWNKCETFRRVVLTVWAAIKSAIGKVVDWFKSTAWPIIQRIIGFIAAYYRFLWSVVVFVFNAIRAAIGKVVDWFKGTAWPIIQRIIGYMRSYFSALADLVASAWAGIRSAIDTVVGWLSTARGRVSSFVDSVAGIFRGLADSVGDIWGGIQSTISGVITWIEDKISWLTSSIGNIPGLGNIIGGARSFTPDTVNPLTRGAFTTGSSSSTSGAPLIVINGALDPDAVARQVETLLSNHAARMGRPLGTRARAW